MQVATSLASVVLVSIRPVYRAGELRHALNLSGCRGLVMAPHFADSGYVRLLREIAPEIEATPTGGGLGAEAPPFRSVILATGCRREEPLRESPAGFLSYEELVADRRADRGLRSRIEALTVELDAHDPINIRFTSGTSGLPLGYQPHATKNILNKRLYRSRPRSRPRRPHLRSRPALPLLRHRPRQPRVHDARHSDGVSVGGHERAN